MILTGTEIEKQVINNKIIISPFDKSRLNPNSYNFQLDNKLLIYKCENLDPYSDNSYDIITIPESGYLLKPNELYLGNTIEKMGSEYYVPMICARSSIGRLGLFINITAPLGDIGFIGQWTLQLAATQPIIVYPSMQIGQIMFWAVDGKINLYKGKYQNSSGPQYSKSYHDKS